MQRETPVQIEIFSSTDSSLKGTDAKKSALSYIWNYEKIILLIMGFLAVSIISFSLGVKKGMQLSMLKEKKESKIEAQTIEYNPKIIKGEIKTIEEKKDIQVTPKEEDVKYTIQVATYLTRTYAQKEAEKLEKIGLKPLVLPKGNYVLLCVGKFFNRDEANVTLKELKKKYQDCFIRRL